MSTSSAVGPAPVQTPPVATAATNANATLHIFENIGIFVAGATVLMIHLALYRMDSRLLAAFMCVTMIAFMTALTIWLSRKRSTLTAKSYSMWMYASICTMFLEFVVLVFIVASTAKSGFNVDSVYRTQSTSYNRR